MLARVRYSYRDDPDVPAFDDKGPRCFMDGECVLCSFGARLIARFDRRDEFRIFTIQSETGQAVLRHYGLDPADPDTWLFLDDGAAFSSMDAMVRAARRIGGPGWMLQPIRLLPARAQNWLYTFIADNRYKWFGRTDICALPDPKLRAKLIE